MKFMPSVERRTRAVEIPPLVNGDRLTQPEFHRRYEACAKDIKAELIGGVVYMASPLYIPHGSQHHELSGAFFIYKASTPGVQVLDNTTVVLGTDSEPQPDLAMRILPEYGGRTETVKKKIVKGPPELVAEVAVSTYDFDLFEKKSDYHRAGVLEYLVLCVEQKELQWFDLRRGAEIAPVEKGVFKSSAFPGLWINLPAILACNSAGVMKTVQKGLATPEHAAFVKLLQAAHKKKSRKRKSG